MCGRYSLAVSKERINKQFNLSIKENLDGSYNISPTQSAYVISNDQPKAIQKMSWGLIPYWSKDKKTGANLINARREGIASRPSFRMPIRKRRCLVLADGFYEWRKEGRKRVPYRITMENNSLMAMAGIWDKWEETSSGEIIYSFAIITSPPNAEMQNIHDRMPVILPSEEMQQDWLKDLPLEDTLNMMQTLSDGQLNVFPISEKVNKVSNNSADLYHQIELPPTLFVL